MTHRTRIIVAICTYKRNGPLANLLEALVACAAHVRTEASVGVVVVDDTAEGEARAVAENFADRFENGLTYAISGRRNISLARNLAIGTAMQLGDWTAMTDDDCEPRVEWLGALLSIQRQTGADAVTGHMVRRVPDGSPAWITQEPFLGLGLAGPGDGQAMDVAYTNNAMVSSKWLLDHPDIRFDARLGNLGGEDMVFFRSARAVGLRIHFSSEGFVYENEPASRVTLRYQLRRFWWHGNSTYVTLVERGQSPLRVLVHGVATLVRALGRPLARMARGQGPQLRYTLASVLLAAGIMVGILGVRVRHN